MSDKRIFFSEWTIRASPPLNLHEPEVCYSGHQSLPVLDNASGQGHRQEGISDS